MMHTALPTVLMIDDDVRLSRMVGQYLRKEGLDFRHADHAAQGLELLQNGTPPHALILDLMLPDADGLQLCQQIRALPGVTAKLPILMLTARGDAADRVQGLELGADDYLPKPFEPAELLARLKALLRRVPRLAEFDAARLSQELLENGEAGAVSANSGALHWGDLSINPAARSVHVAGVAKTLTAHQFDLLYMLAQNVGKVLSREHIMQRLKGKDLEAFDRSIDVHMGRIRAAIEQDPKSPKRIVTLRGVGYMFDGKS